MDEWEIIDTLKKVLQARVERDATKAPCKVYATKEYALFDAEEKAEDLARAAKMQGCLEPDHDDSLPYLVFESESLDGWVVAIDLTEAIKDADGMPQYFMP